jgi:hypothetical protein
MTRIAHLALLLMLPGLAAAQDLRSGPNAPAVGAQVPPTEPPRARPDQPGRAPGSPDARTGSGDARTAPPPDHRVLGGPPVPGARRPDHSEGITTNRDPIPARPRTTPDATTTGR